MITRKKTRFASGTGAFVVFIILGMCVAGAAVAAAPAKELPSRAEIRSQLKSLSPDERESKIMELRRRYDSPAQGLGGRRGPDGGMNRETRERMERIQRDLRNMTPAEREGRIAEMRRRRDQSMRAGGALGPQGADLSQLTLAQREEFLKLRRKLQELPESERPAMLREFLSKLGIDYAPGPNGAVDRAQQFRQMRERMQARVAELEKKHADGTINEQEKRQLERMKQLGRNRSK